METNLILDSILKELEKNGWYIGYEEVCNKLNVPSNKRNYVLSKLKDDGLIDVLDTKVSTSIKINNKGIVFINESGYLLKKETESRNNVSINGDGNIIVQGINDSKVILNSKEKTNNNSKKEKKSVIIGIVVAILSLIVTIIIGWDNIIKFLGL